MGNVPFIRPTILGELPFTTALGPGWEVEAYRGGRLIAFDSVNALGQFSLDVPIAYGENPVDFIAYGPFGEVRQFNRTYRVSTNAIQQHRFEYALSGGACRSAAPCEATANADLRYGVTPRITVFGGLDRFWRDTLPDLFHPYGGFIAGITNAFAVEAEYVGDAIARGQLRFEPSSDLLLVAEGTRFARDVEAPILTLPGRKSQFTFFGQVRPIKGALRNWIVFDASVDRIESETERFTHRATRRVDPAGTGALHSHDPLGAATRRPDGGGHFRADPVRVQRHRPADPRPGHVLRPDDRAGGGRIRRTPLDARSASGFVSRPMGGYVRLEVGSLLVHRARRPR